jgi:DNA-binding NarL/FixJ family response regulator
MIPSHALDARANPVGGNVDARPSLLIADDDAVVRSALRSQLEGGFNVIAVAENATEAIELAEKHQPDAALLDVEMPDGGALAAVPEIARRSANTSMVILSGDESREVVLALINAGAITYIRKGVSAAHISKTLNDALTVGPTTLGA